MIPRDEIVMLRDWLYESDRITMGGIADINKLLKKYEVSPVVRCKDCVNRYLTGRAPFMYYACTVAEGLNVCKEDSFCSYGERKDDGKNSMDG